MSEHRPLESGALADKLLAAEVFSELLVAADPDQLGESFAQQVRELTGARTVMLIANATSAAPHRVLGVCPERRAGLFAGFELDLLCRGGGGGQSCLTEDIPAAAPLGILLRRAQVRSLMRFPLEAANELLGWLVLLDLPEWGRIYEIATLVTMIIPVSALALRSSLAHEQIKEQAREFATQTRDFELQVASRVADLVTENSELAADRVAALRRIEDAVAARRRAERLAAALQREVEERRRAEDELRRFKLDLEVRVASRTAELEAANRELEAFVYSVSHDLRAPLRAIDGFSYIVAEDAEGRLTDADREHLQRVRAAAQRMGTLIDELLAFSRASRQQPLSEDVDMVELVGAVVDELRRVHPERRVDVVVAPHLRARADPSLLRMILENLLGNAWKFTSHHHEARIEVGAIEVNGERAYFVRDDGAGFDAGAAHHLFGAFQRYHSPDEFDGDGIGLAIVHRLVGRHGGRVWAESAVEQGATFYFTLGPSPAAN